MEQHSIIKDKLSQHEFDYREGAWEKMDTLLAAATPPASPQLAPRSSFSKWWKMLGAAAVVTGILYVAVSTTTPTPLEWAGSFTAQPARPLETPSVPQENKTFTAPKIAKSTAENPNNLPIDEPQLTTQQVFSIPFVDSHKENKKKEHIAEPVDDSKVYRENKNHKNPNHIIDEHSKVPAITD
jgi:hypothetical protein